MAAAHESGWISDRGRHPFLTSLQIRERGWTRVERVERLLFMPGHGLLDIIRRRPTFRPCLIIFVPVDELLSDF